MITTKWLRIAVSFILAALGASTAIMGFIGASLYPNLWKLAVLGLVVGGFFGMLAYLVWAIHFDGLKTASDLRLEQAKRQHRLAARKSKKAKDR